MIEAAATVGRQRERDRLLLTLIYRHGLRVSEAVDLRWTDFDLDAPRDRPFYVRRLKGSKNATHTLEPDTVRALKRIRQQADGAFVFRSERGGPMSVECRADDRCPGWQGSWTWLQGASATAAACMRLLPRGRGPGYAHHPGLSWAQGHQEHGRVYGNQPAPIGGGACEIAATWGEISNPAHGRLRDFEALQFNDNQEKPRPSRSPKPAIAATCVVC